MSKHMKRCSISIVIGKISKFKLLFPTSVLSIVENTAVKSD